MKNKLIIIALTALISLFFLLACDNEKNVISGADNFLYTKYIGKNEEVITDINIPLITREKINVISLTSVNASVEELLTFHIEGFREIGEYKGFNAYVISMDITDIKQSFVIEKFFFEIKSSEKIEYTPKAFIIVKTDYEVVSHDEFKLLTSIIKFNNIPSKIKYQVDSESYKIKDIKSLHLINKWEYSKELDYMSNLRDYINIDIIKIQCENPLYVNFNFQFNVENDNETYSYIDNIEINLLSMSVFEEVIDNGL